MKKIVTIVLILTMICCSALSAFADAIDENTVREMFAMNMSEVLDMTDDEQTAAEVVITKVENYPLWQATMTINGNVLTRETKETLSFGAALFDAYNADTDTYTYVQLFEETENGLVRIPDARSLDEYEYTKLIESIVWPGSNEDVHGYYHRFLTATAADKAAFTAEYKPVADNWYAEHPDFAAKLEKGYNDGTILDTLYMVTRHTYGVPADETMNEEQIRSLAADTYAKLLNNASVDELLSEKFETYVWYDVTDESNPVWKVTVRANADANPTGYMNYETRYMVFAVDGTLLRDAGESRWVAGEEVPATPSVSDPIIDSDQIEF